MIRGLAPLFLALIAAVTMGATAQAGCACMCVDGNVVPACSSTLDIPPICPMRTCTQPTVRPPLGITSRRACADTQVCDQYGHCEWKPVCP
jgi:hypothetical protein